MIKNKIKIIKYIQKIRIVLCRRFNVVEDFKKQCREEHIKSAMEEIVDYNKEVAYYQKKQKKGRVPEWVKGIVEMYTVDDFTREWASMSQEFSEVMIIMGNWELYSEIEEDLSKVRISK